MSNTKEVIQNFYRTGQILAKRDMPCPSAFPGMRSSLVSTLKISRSRWLDGDLRLEIDAKTLKREEIRNVS